MTAWHKDCLTEETKDGGDASHGGGKAAVNHVIERKDGISSSFRV